MTCIVGIEYKGSVWLGGDSAATSGSGRQTIIGDPKVFLVGDLAFGVCGLPKVMDVLAHKLEFPKNDAKDNDREFMAKELMPFIVSQLTEAGCVQQHPKHGALFEGALLMAYRGKLYQVQSNFQLITNSFGFDSVGSGAEVALGSLQSSQKGKPEKRINDALTAAALNNFGVRPPFNVVVLKKDSIWR